jgi:diacylglycerol kinase (ATP)
VDHPFGRALLVVNPRAGRRGTTTLDALRPLLDARGLPHDVHVTTGPGDATRAARLAVEDRGVRYVIAVGGDGTVHEVLNGLVDAESGVLRGDDPVLGVVSDGSGCDLVRTFGLDRPVATLVDHLISDDVLPIDVGRVRHRGPDGRERTTVFANIAEVGFGGRVARVAARLPRRLGPGRYGIGIVVAWGGFRRIVTRIVHDGGSYEGPLCNVVVANAQFFGGGMHVAPRALPTDGRFNLQAWGGTPTDVVRAGRQLRDGSHLSRSDVREWQSEVVTIDADVPLSIEADGEPLGTTPARFDLLPRLLRFKL